MSCRQLTLTSIIAKIKALNIKKKADQEADKEADKEKGQKEAKRRWTVATSSRKTRWLLDIVHDWFRSNPRLDR